MDKEPSRETQLPKGNAVRTRVRLKHSFPAGAEIKAVLPDTLEEFENASACEDFRAILDDAH